MLEVTTKPPPPVPYGEVVLDNERVVVQKFVIQPGQSTGPRTSSVDQPTIDISEGHESRNIGTEPIDLVWVTLKH